MRRRGISSRSARTTATTAPTLGATEIDPDQAVAMRRALEPIAIPAAEYRLTLHASATRRVDTTDVTYRGFV